MSCEIEHYCPNCARSFPVDLAARLAEAEEEMARLRDGLVAEAEAHEQLKREGAAKLEAAERRESRLREALERVGDMAVRPCCPLRAARGTSTSPGSSASTGTGFGASD